MKWESMGSRSYEQPQEKSPWDELAEEAPKPRHDVDVQWTLDHEMDEGAPEAHYPDPSESSDELEQGDSEGEQIAKEMQEMADEAERELRELREKM